MYFEVGNEENCYPRQYFQELANDRGMVVNIQKAKVQYGNGYFYCDEFGEVGEVGNGECGILCSSYSPRNKKSGRCRHSKNTYVASGDIIQIKPIERGRYGL